MANLVLKNNTATNDVMLELNRGTNASWRMVNNSGTLYLKCNYTDTVGDYYNVFSLAYNTGNATLKGALSIGGALSVADATTLSSTVSVGNIMTFTNSTEANRKITSSSGAMYYSSQSTTYIDSGASSSIIFRPQGTEQARFNTSGQLQIKSTGAANATIIGPGTAGTFYFPNTGGTFVTHATRGTAVGGGTQPVYIASTGRATASTSTVGTSTKPVYLKNGVITEGSTYAGGTNVTLNGSGKSGSTASFYAPTAAGTSGQLLVSSGGAPTWKNLSDIADSRYVNVSGDTMTGALNLANGTWNKAGDDASFGDNNTAGAFCIRGLNGATALKMASNSDDSYGMLRYNTTNESIEFIFG